MRHSLKLASRYYGPFQVAAKIGMVAYQLNLPSNSKIHLVSHASCLKKKLGKQISHLPTLPPLDQEGYTQHEPSILERRMKRVRNHAVIEVLLKWLGATFVTPRKKLDEKNFF